MQRRESPDRPPFRRSYGGPQGGGGYRGGGGRDRDGGFRRPSYGGPPGPAVDYKALVEYVARSVADKPAEVEVLAIDRGRGTVAVKVKMADEDMGRLIGKAGRNIEALRTLVRVASLRERKRVFVDLATGR
ncbi:MAG TPA: KH domain-containing protein [Candidatus Dormibacteraeota bacterium]